MLFNLFETWLHMATYRPPQKQNDSHQPLTQQNVLNTQSAGHSRANKLYIYFKEKNLL
jgi:hypothetical protein